MIYNLATRDSFPSAERIVALRMLQALYPSDHEWIRQYIEEFW
jgi:hypothetical protein